MTQPPVPESILALRRPHRALWTYYIITAICTGPGVVFTLPYLFFRYHTLRYRFDAEGIHMKVGILFRREINLTYARIQDIHLRSGVLQRWLGFANVQIQTASGSAGPEMVIEGFKEYEAIRDFLYTRMRGYQSTMAATPAVPITATGTALAANSAADNEVIELLRQINSELRRTREAIEKRQPGLPPGVSPTEHV
jgi:uncharacterized membrane protein YdbT with pleckstrin-like domain